MSVATTNQTGCGTEDEVGDRGEQDQAAAEQANRMAWRRAMAMSNEPAHYGAGDVGRQHEQEGASGIEST